LRKFLIAISAALIAVSASGCASNSTSQLVSDAASIKPTCNHYTSANGDDASKVSITSGTAGAPTVKIDGALTGSEISTHVITEGTGIAVTGDQMVDMEYVGLNGGNSTVFQKSKWDGTDMAGQYLKPGEGLDFCHALSGVKEGSTVAIVVPAQIAHGGKGITELKIGPTDPVVFVFKLSKVFLPHAVGSEQPQQAGFPSVVRAPNGQPGITMLGTDAPTTQKTAVLIQGHGDKLKKGDSITVHYTGAVWNQKVTFDSSWTKGEPAQFELKDGSLIPGFIDALVGQRIGSQIITVIPADKAYGDQAQGEIPANSTLVFVIDILGVTK
jgi:peptidylprolyl isomerase